MTNIEIYQDYTFMDDDGYKYTLSVEDDFTYIGYHDDELMLPTASAYEIVKKIIEEYEEMNKND